MRTGIFGGTFDPIHNGHLLSAVAIKEALQFDKIIFIPTGDPPCSRGEQTGDIFLTQHCAGCAPRPHADRVSGIVSCGNGSIRYQSSWV